ncbi:hypothetical protein HMPREF1580_01319, partial [Gardnerella vaginalis JCP8070]
RREIHQTFWMSKTFAQLSSPRFSIFLLHSMNHHFMLRFISFRAKNLESLPNLAKL